MDKVQRIHTRLVRVPLQRPVGWATATVDCREYVLVTIETADGVRGTGVTVGSRFIGGGRVIKTIVDEVLAPAILGQDSLSIRALWDLMQFRCLLLGRNGAATRAVSAVDIALWDALGQRSGLSVAELLGRCRTTVPVYSSGGYFYPPDDFETEVRRLQDEVGAAADRGIRAVKIKIGRLSPAQDRLRVLAVRERVGPDVQIAVDANNAWRTAAEAINALRDLDPLGLMWIEEPVLPDQLTASAEVARSLVTPIACGEIEAGLRSFAQVIDSGAASVIQVDATVAGGISEWVRVAAFAEARDVAVAPHWMADLHVQLGAATPGVTMLEYFDQSVGVLNFAELIENPLVIDDGAALLPVGPGHGLQFDQQAIERFEVK